MKNAKYSIKYSMMVLVVSLLTLPLLLACSSDNNAAPSAPSPAQMPDIEATVEARVQATLAAAPTASPPEPMAAAHRLELVRERGVLICSSNNTLAGFGYLDDAGNTRGFDIDLCRAVAAAVLGDPDAVEFHATTAAERGPVMQSGEVDMMSRNTTWTSSRDVQWGNFAQTMFYDGQGFMAPTALGISSLLELKDSSICVQQGTTTELNLQDFSNQNDMNFSIITFPDNISTNTAYLNEQCDAITTDRSGLVSTKAEFPNPDEHIILPGTISEEPLGPVVPSGDDQWYDTVKMVMSILIYAEAYGITSDNVPTALTGQSDIDRLFGLEGSFGQEGLGLSQDRRPGHC